MTEVLEMVVYLVCHLLFSLFLSRFDLYGNAGIFEATATDPSTHDLDQGNGFLKEDRPPVNMSALPS